MKKTKGEGRLVLCVYLCSLSFSYLVGDRLGPKEDMHKCPYCCEVQQQVCDQNSASHEQFVCIAFMSTGCLQGHPVWIQLEGNGSTQPAVVGSEGRVVKSPVLQIIPAGVEIPKKQVTHHILFGHIFFLNEIIHIDI